jgi:hypothetical protein
VKAISNVPIEYSEDFSAARPRTVLSPPATDLGSLAVGGDDV